MIIQKTTPDLTPGIVFELMIGPIRHAVLESAFKMNMADILADHQNPKAIAKALNLETDETNLIYFLDAMASMGFAVKEDGTYSNTDFAEAYMRKESPTYLGGLVENLTRMQHRNLNRIPELIRTGPPKVESQDRLEKEEKWKESVHHLASYHKAGMANDVADLVSSLPEFPSMQNMLDLGCGPGIMCMTIVQRHPSLKGVLCDLPTVMDVAREEIAEHKLESRVSTIDGDYNDTDFGKGYDLIWASHTLYYARDLSTLLSRAYEALNPGGVFISFHEGLTCEQTQPTDMILSRLSLALEGQDVSFNQGEIASHLLKVGFSSIEIRTLEMPMGPMDLIIARKHK